MAHPEELAPAALPETLPEDFGEWDGEGPAPATPVYSWDRTGTSKDVPVYSTGSEAARSSTETPKLQAQSAESDAIPASSADTPVVMGSASSAPVTAQLLRDYLDWDNDAPPASRRVNPSEWEAWEASISARKTPKPFGPSAERNPNPSSPAGKPRGSGSASPAPASAKSQKDAVDRSSETPRGTERVNPNEWEAWQAAHSGGKTSKPFGPSSDRKATASAVMDRPRVSGSSALAPDLAPQPEMVPVLVDESPNHASHELEAGQIAIEAAVAPERQNAAALDDVVTASQPAATHPYEADEALRQMFSLASFDVSADKNPAAKKRMIIAAVGGSSLLLGLIFTISMLHHGSKPAAQQSVQAVPVAMTTEQTSNTAKPSAGEPLAQNKALAAADAPTADDQAADAASGADAAPAPTDSQTKMMNDQLAAPTRIPQGIKKQVAEDEPPPASLSMSGADGLGGSAANVSIFNGRAQSIVKAPPPKPLVISSGVATGMLIQKTPPVYPLIAKSARVSGTVELHATISKSGWITDLHVVSGPDMLRQAALDAVRQWRYKPYTLNNQPTEVETTINVVFTLVG
jgi:protein TonB